jgi:FtsP/CotA-like multicopper oxidase with cupredoxin domain
VGHVAKSSIDRRSFLGFGTAAGQRAAAVPSAPGVLDVYINEGFLPMVDGSLVYHRGFGDRPAAANDPEAALRLAPHVFTATGQVVASRHYPLGAALPPHGRPQPLGPDPESAHHYLVRRAYWASFFPPRTLIAETGSTIRLRVHNTLAQPHQLVFHDVGPGGSAELDPRGVDVGTGPIAPGAVGEVVLDAPEPGTYVFSDPGNGPVERVLGLHGALVVIDPADAWRLAPGRLEFERQWLWICHDIVPEWAAIAARGGTVDPDADPGYVRYFTLNNYAGFQSLAVTADHGFNDRRYEDTLPSGFPRQGDVRDLSASRFPGTVRTGQMIRMVNTGIVDHQLHYHGNHVWVVRANGFDFPRGPGFVHPLGRPVLQRWEDTVFVNPMERKEALLPCRRPPEVTDAVWEARTKDWIYPMHCHAEPSQTAAGGLYPGGMVADWVLAAHPEPEEHGTYASQVDFASSQPHEGSPETEFPQRPDVSLEFDFFNRKLEFPDGSEHEVWSFEAGDTGRQLPGTLMRAVEGQIVHGTIKPSKNVHTIHWHGIEPDPRNDGVGHTSFEVSGHYTYQWRPEPGIAGSPNEGTAGTYFYHCHVNTPLHVQYGMFGPIIIDPPNHDDVSTPGARRSFVDGPEYDIATETLIGPYSVDSRWHDLHHAAGLSGEDAGLNRFEADHFYLLGGIVPERPAGDLVWSISEMRANVEGSGRAPTLVRFVNVDYFPTLTRFTDAAGTPVPMAEIISQDGRPLRNTANPAGPALPVGATGNRMLTSTIASGAAEKYDLLLRPPAPGQYRIHVDFLTWRPRAVRATRTITVTAA